MTDHDRLNERISRISTLWSLVSTAHRGPAQAASDAQVRLLERYSGAVHRYLRGALRDENAAEELAQEFALRFIRGDFQGVDPSKGRFRDYLRTVLYRMAARHWKQRHPSDSPWPPRATGSCAWRVTAPMDVACRPDKPGRRSRILPMPGGKGRVATRSSPSAFSTATAS